MEIFVGLIMYFFGRKLHNWYGYDKGREDPLYWKPIHDNQKVFLIITITSILMMYLGIGLVIYKLFVYAIKLF
jgi:hypothetical protein